MNPLRLRALAVVLAAAFAAAAVTVARSEPAQDLSVLDLVMLEVSYDTMTSQYYQRVAPQRLADGARTGIVAYLRGRGIAQPHVGYPHAATYAQGLHALNREVAQTLQRYGARVSSRPLIYGAISGELAAVRDPYTVFFTPAEYKAFVGFLNPSTFGGVGVVLAFEGTCRGTPRPAGDSAGGPADKAGLHAGERRTAGR